ncbi:MAG TPA: selenium metabolism-associated LysR family transcriptional regulator [Smithella sp.]|nr:selenium metabolism-associated LysR family transcriptional regulator [Smithella sp.]
MTVDRFRYITIQQLEAIIALVKEGSFSRAAKRMLLTQPALTKNIKNAEDFVGARLVNRSSAGITLTPEGKILYDYARRVVRLRNEAKEKVLALRKEIGGNIYLSASTIPATYILPRVLSDFNQTEAGIHIYIKTADSEEAMNMVLDNEVEMGVIGKKPLNKILTAEALWKDRLVLVVSADHVWRKKKSVTMPELLKEPFVIREKGSATRDLFEFHLKKSKTFSLDQFNICGELGSSEAIKEAVISGWGISAISVHAVSRELAQGLLYEVPIQGFTMERNFYLIYKRQFDFRPFHKIFVNFIKNCSPAHPRG